MQVLEFVTLDHLANQGQGRFWWTNEALRTSQGIDGKPFNDPSDEPAGGKPNFD